MSTRCQRTAIFIIDVTVIILQKSYFDAYRTTSFCLPFCTFLTRCSTSAHSKFDDMSISPFPVTSDNNRGAGLGFLLNTLKSRWIKWA